MLNIIEQLKWKREVIRLHGLFAFSEYLYITANIVSKHETSLEHF
jgi:hypothetical protein